MNADEIRAKWDKFGAQVPKGATPIADAALVNLAFFLAEVAAQLAEIHDDLMRMRPIEVCPSSIGHFDCERRKGHSGYHYQQGGSKWSDADVEAWHENHP